MSINTNKEEALLEYWDILDRQRNFTGKLHKRGEPFPEDDEYSI